MFAAISLNEVLQFASSMNSLGQEANISEDRFAALTSTMGGYEEVMQGMRRATMGVVDDMHIQQNAMLLIQSAGIDTSKELENMTNMIMRLKKPSEDASTAISNFSLMLANNSVLRLDSFGLSASKVRARIIELMESGEALDRSQAFRMAVLEQGAEAVARFGDAADAAGTSFSRLGTIVENVKQDFGQQLNIGVESSAGLIELALGIHPAQIAETERRTEAAARSLADDTMAVFKEVMASGTSGDANFIGAYVQNALVLAKADPALAGDIEAFTSQLFEGMRASGQADMGDLFGVGGIEELREITNLVLKLQNIGDDMRAQEDRAANATARAAEEAEKRWQAEARTERVLAMQNSWQDRIHGKAQELLQQQQLVAQHRSDFTGAMGGLLVESRAVTTDASPYATEEQAHHSRNIADEAQRLLETIEKMDEATPEMFTDEQLENIREEADLMGNIADRAEEMADAFKNISLSELFGQQSGGTLGEMTDELVADMEKLQFSAQQIKDFQDELDLTSGRETGVSQLFRDQISDAIAGIGVNISQDLAKDMLMDFDATMKDAVLRGIDTSQPEFLDKLNETFNNINFDPESFNVSEFLQEFDPAALATTTMNEQGAAFADSTVIAKDNMAATESSVNNIGTALGALSSKTTKIPVQLEFVNLNALAQMLFAPLFQMVTAAGGVTPGTSQTASTSGDMTRRR